jgi:hypothetical protein
MTARLAARASKPTLAISALAGIGAGLLPKCPLCIAAMLSALGMGATGAALLSVLARPGLLVLAGGALVAVVAVQWRRRATRAIGCCSEGARSRTP